MRVRFGTFVLDQETRELLSGDARVPLSPKAFDLLSILIAHRPKAMAKSDLQERLWPTSFVVEKNLANLIGEIRDALGDDPSNPRFIRTVHRFGYAFREPLPRARTSAASRGGAVSFIVKWVNGRVTLDEGDARARPRPRRGDLPELPRSLAASRADHDLGGPGGDRGPREQERDVCRG